LALGVVAALAEGLTYSLLIPFLRLLFGSGGAFPAAPTAIESLLRSLVGGLLGATHGTVALAIILGCIAGMLLLKNACLYVAAYVSHVVQEGVVRDLRVAVYGRIQQLGLPFFAEHRGGELAARLLSDADQTRGAILAVGTTVRSGAAVIVYLGILFAVSPPLALAALGLVVTVTLGLRPLLRSVRARWASVTERRGRLGAVVVETALAARAVKGSAAEEHEAARFGAAADGVRDGVLRAERLALLASPLTETVAGASLLLVLAAAGAAGGLRPELFVAFVAVALRMLSPMKAVAQFPALLGEAEAAGDRLLALLRRPPEDVDPPGIPAFPGVREAVEFRDVWVAYRPGAWVLRGVHLRIARGEVVAVVGSSGAGKSTLADLLPRFVDPSRGAVLVDGVSLASYGRQSVRAALGIVNQETVLVHESVRANIAYGDRSGASSAEIEAAARAANAHAFIERLPEGYETAVGERGIRLSGGERQRIAIARALLRDPPLLILDEATAQLDAESEATVQEAIGRLMAGRTVLVIAHRLAVAARADRIVVLERGRIVEAGTHRELLQAAGRYRELVERQALVGEVAPSPGSSGSFVGQVAGDEGRLELDHLDR
jgi:subfamily B ATP-binding cassette protein MsbA